MSVPIFLTVVAVVAVCFLLTTLMPLRLLNGRMAGPDPQLQRALKAVRSGAWQPAAELLAAAGTDWDRRTRCAGSLAYSAVHDGDAWLKAWQAADPDHPDAVMVAACARVKQAWKLRGAQRAVATSQEQFDAFHRELHSARGALAHAAKACPDDPTPLADTVWVALGLGYPKDAMADLWAEVQARSPHHFAAHHAAVQYYCRKWRGSRAEAEEFAARAVQQAPRGHLMTLLPLLVWFEHEEEGDSAGRYGMPDAIAMVDAALEDVAAAEGHAYLPEARHLLAYFLVKQGRHRAALAQFREVDGYTNAIPWRYRPWGKLSYRLHRSRAVWGALLTRR
ncbi:hypothetical protein [Streptomyces sp. NPDC056491]|uniref:hypothetical protein n=1 Tax=Streptomyces sp. NPDC056491 TaxID=3345837 RepID=UPI0036B5AED5